jgi:amino-acid N-acetyltransferase
VADFFRKLGFEEVERGALPLKAWKDCLRCPKFQACDEIAVLKPLQAQATLPKLDDPFVQIPLFRIPV